MDLRPGLEDAVRTLRAGSPFLPVAVVVPNHLLGVWLSRSIFKDTGHMAIEFVLAHELAWKVAAPSLLRTFDEGALPEVRKRFILAILARRLVWLQGIT